MPHHSELLKLLDLQAGVSKFTTCKGVKCLIQNMPHKANGLLKPVYLANTFNSCTICSVTKHPLYACRKFRSLSHNQRMVAVKSNQLCFNCLKSGLVKQECPLLQRCQVCHRPHQTLLYLDDDRQAPTTAGRQSQQRSHSPSAAMSEPLILHLHVTNSQGDQGQVLLMTCHVRVMTPGDTTMQARVLCDFASSTSFITER